MKVACSEAVAVPIRRGRWAGEIKGVKGPQDKSQGQSLVSGLDT